MDSDFYKTYFEIEKSHWWSRVRRNIVLGILKEYIQNNPTSLKIHDFGCGSGVLVGELQRLGYNASGSDMSVEAIDFGKSQGVINLGIARNGQLSAPRESFDVVLALDVIEHIKDDVMAVHNLKNVLKSGGVLVITVPAYQWMWGIQDEVARHFRRYSMKSLLLLFPYSSGFSVVKKSYFNTFLFLPIVGIRLAHKIFKIKEKRESDFDINNKFMNGIFYFIFNLESKLLRFVNFPFGVSALLVLKKN